MFEFKFQGWVNQILGSFEIKTNLESFELTLI
jgi:hypothetical protein